MLIVAPGVEEREERLLLYTYAKTVPRYDCHYFTRGLTPFRIVLGK